MKGIAIGLLIFLLLSSLIQPMMESAVVMKDRLAMSTALSNACRAAKFNSIPDEILRDRNAEIDAELFRDCFSEAFEDAMDTYCISVSGNTLVFSENDTYNKITVTLDISSYEDWNGQIVTTAEVDAKAPYKFKTPFMKASDEADVNFTMECKRSMLVRVVN